MADLSPDKRDALIASMTLEQAQEKAEQIRRCMIDLYRVPAELLDNLGMLVMRHQELLTALPYKSALPSTHYQKCPVCEVPTIASTPSLVAPIHPLVEAVRWILQDAAYKAPEQIGVVAERWIDRLRDAMTQEGKPVSVPSTTPRSEPTKEQRQAISDLLLTMRDKMTRGEEINWLAMPHELWRALGEGASYVPSATACSADTARLDFLQTTVHYDEKDPEIATFDDNFWVQSRLQAAKGDLRKAIDETMRAADGGKATNG